MTAYVSQVEFADGSWVPSRKDLDSSPLLRITAPSPEEERLADIYAKKGLAALITELNLLLSAPNEPPLIRTLRPFRAATGRSGVCADASTHQHPPRYSNRAIRRRSCRRCP